VTSLEACFRAFPEYQLFFRVEKRPFWRFADYTPAACNFGTRHRLKAAAVITNCQPTFHSPRSFVFRMPPVCFIHPNAFSISGRFPWLTR
jgi:hypothetical protein